MKVLNIDNKFLPGLMPYRIKDLILFKNPAIERGVGMAIPKVESIDGKPILKGVIIPQRIDITYDRYKTLCKTFVKMNLKKYTLKTVPHQEKQSFLIILNDEYIKIDWKELPDFVDVVNADKAISSRKTHKILVKINMLLDYIHEVANEYELGNITIQNGILIRK